MQSALQRYWKLQSITRPVDVLHAPESSTGIRGPMNIPYAYVVATIKPWNIECFHKKKTELPGKWHLITNPDELSFENIEKTNPRYVFFPHWSWVVPREIFLRWECVCFHMTDLPYGRGGGVLCRI